MIRSPLGLRLNAGPPVRDQLRESAKLGAKGVVADATAELAPERLSDTGRREVRHLLRSLEVTLIALHLPTRRPFDTEDQLEDRLQRADRAFPLALELGAPLVLARLGAMPAETDAPRREVFLKAVRDLGRRAEHRGVRLAIETGTEPGESVRAVLDALDSPGLAASLDPSALLRQGQNPSDAARALGPWVAHAYAHTPPSTIQASSSFAYRSPGSPSGTLDWEEYLGALEEINYRGFLTVWPDPNLHPGPQFKALVELLRRF
jgi:sugar phosphate isomerase/epimerase